MARASSMSLVDLRSVVLHRVLRVLEVLLRDALAQAVLSVLGEVLELDGGLILEPVELEPEERVGNAGVDGDRIVLHAQVDGLADGDERGHSGHDERDEQANDGEEQRALVLAGDLPNAAVVGDVDHHDGDVVSAACGERGVDQVVRADLRGGALLGDALDLAVWDHARHAIGAQDEAVALLDVQGEMVGVHRRIGAQGSRDDGPVGMRARLVGGDLAGIDELLDVGVIARDADEGALV